MDLFYLFALVGAIEECEIGLGVEKGFGLEFGRKWGIVEAVKSEDESYYEGNNGLFYAA